MTRKQALELAKIIMGERHPQHETALSQALIEAEADLAIAKEALERIETCGSEAINGIFRGFIGNAEADMRKSQAILRQALSKLNKRGGE